MNTMINTTNMEPRSSIEIGLDSKTIRTLGYRIVDIIADEFSHPDRRPPRPSLQKPEVVEQIFDRDLPEDGVNPEELLKIVQESFLPLSPNHSHSGLFSHISSASVPFPALIASLVASLRLYSYDWSMSPASTQIEKDVISWLGQFIGYHHRAAGYIATGGTSANLMGLLTARVAQTGRQINTKGLYGNKILTAYVSETAHSCLDQSMRIMGLGNNQLRKIPTDYRFRAEPGLLEQAVVADLKEGYQPFCIIGIAGSTDIGAIDDLEALSAIAKKYNLWFHIDGAYGAFAASLPFKRELFLGIDKADSVVCDPHKWLNIPFEAGALLVKNRNYLKDAFSIRVNCMDSVNTRNIHDEWNYWEHGFELTRSDRALKIWLALKQFGARSYRRMIENHIVLIEYMAEQIQESEKLQLIARPVLSICCFRYIGKNTTFNSEQLDKLNTYIEETMQAEGGSVVGTTRINDQSVLRACIISHRITKSSVDTLLKTVVRVGDKKVDLMLNKGKSYEL